MTRVARVTAVLLLFASAAIAWPGRWIGTWSASPQQVPDGRTYANQTLRLIAHVSAGGKKVRVRISNAYGETPLLIGSAHIARRTAGADIDAASDRALTFAGQRSVRIPAGSMVVSDAVGVDVPALSDVAISLFLPESTKATTSHLLAKQTNYVSPETGDATAAVNFPVAKTIAQWPFLAGVDVIAPRSGTAIVAFGSSLTDGDGSTKDANQRWPDLLAQRLQKKGRTDVGVLNEGVIGNRLLADAHSPRQTGGALAETYKQLGVSLGESGLRRFRRDVLDAPGVRFVILALAVNDILFPGAFVAESEAVTAQSLIDGNLELIARAHRHGIRAIGATIPPFEHALFRSPFYDRFDSPEKEKVRQEVNEWVRHSKAFDGFIDFDAAVRDPDHPTQILPAFDSGDHLHVNDAGNAAQVNAIALSLFE